MDNRETLSRRRFLKLFFGGAAAIYTSCHSAKYQILDKTCPTTLGSGQQLRIMSFNIANARGNTDNFFEIKKQNTILHNLDWIIKLIREYDIDVACFNEVDFNSFRTYNIDMPDYIANDLCYNHIIRERMFDLPSILEVGNAVISKYPLRLNKHHQFGHGFADRISNMFKSYLDFDIIMDRFGRKLNVVLTHLDDRSEKIRCKEADTLLKHLRQKKPPFVLLGDLNTMPGEKCFELIINSGLVQNPYLGIPTYQANAPTRAIDHILVSSGLTVKKYFTVSLEASDHLPIIADIIID